MPLYEYECDACGKHFEVIQKFSETVEICAECGKGPVHRLLSSPAIQFKGSGWYITDYAQKGKSESAGKSETSEKTEKTEKTDKTDKTDKTERKTEKKADAASPTPSSSSSTPKT